MEFVRERIVEEYLYIKDYRLPDELKDHYNAKGPFDVLLRLNPLALYISRRLKCRHGKPSRTVDDPPALHRTGLKELSSCLNTLDGDPVDATHFNLSQLVDYVDSVLLDWEVSGIPSVQFRVFAPRYPHTQINPITCEPAPPPRNDTVKIAPGMPRDCLCTQINGLQLF